MKNLPEAKPSEAPTAAVPIAAPMLSRVASQKRKTRRAIVKAASEIAAEGRSPTVGEAAERAQVSRATAYRHFPSREFLVVEMALPVGELRTALEQAGRLDPSQRIAAAVRTMAEWCYDHQLVLREMLRVSLAPQQESQGYQRPTGRMELIEREMQPIRALLSAEDYRRLSMALALLLGIEAIVVLKDLAAMSREETIDTLVWAASGLTRFALESGG